MHIQYKYTTETSSYFLVFRASLENFSLLFRYLPLQHSMVSLLPLKWCPCWIQVVHASIGDNNLLDRRIGTQENHLEMLSHAALGIRRPQLLGVPRVRRTHHREISCTYMSWCALVHMANNRTSLVLPCVRCHYHTLPWNLLIMSSKGHISYHDIKCHVNTKAKSNATLLIDCLDHWLWSCAFYQVFELIWKF